MAGQQPGFNAQVFRDRLRFVFTMAATPLSDDQVTFHFEPTITSAAKIDADKVPFNPAVAPTTTTPEPIKVPCAVEYSDAENQPTPFGLMAPTKVQITLLDEDYEQVKDAKYIVIGGDRYDFRRTEPPTGLFDVGLWTMHFTAENET